MKPPDVDSSVFFVTRSVLLSTLLLRQHQWIRWHQASQDVSLLIYPRNKIVRIIICVCAGVWVNLSCPTLRNAFDFVEVWWFAAVLQFVIKIFQFTN